MTLPPAISGMSDQNIGECLDLLGKLISSGRISKEALAEVLIDLANEGFEIRRVGDGPLSPHNYSTSQLLQIIKAR
jgi:hypothetical protein